VSQSHEQEYIVTVHDWKLLVQRQSCCLVTMRSWVQILEAASFRNARKDCIHKTQSDRTLPRTLRKRELRTPDPYMIGRQLLFFKS
jgi:hypothetical protein